MQRINMVRKFAAALALICASVFTLPVFGQLVRPQNGGTGIANNVAATLTRTGSHALTITTSATAALTISNTANQVYFNTAASTIGTSANLLFDNSAVRLTVGTGSGASQGWIIGNQTTAQAMMWTTAVTPSSTNYTLYGDATNTTLNVPSGGTNNIAVANTTKMSFTGTAGAGPSITAGTTTTDVNALSITQTWNAAGVAFTGIKNNFTSTASAAATLIEDWQIGGTSVSALGKGGGLASTSITTGPSLELHSTYAGALARVQSGAVTTRNSRWTSVLLNNASDLSIGWTSVAASGGADAANVADTNLSRISAGVVGVGTGAAGSVAGTLAATNYRIASTLAIGGTAPTLASGGCTSPSAVTANGTARFSVNVGTGCSGSQPLVFTLPAATTGWNCYAQNSSNAATSVAAQSSAISTTSVTITSYSRTTGLAQAWTDADVVVVSCLGG